MLTLLTAVLVSLVYLAALYGWGWGIARAAFSRMPHWSLTAALGLVSWLLIGGLLNAFHLARPPALDGMTLLGLAAWVLTTYHAVADRHAERPVAEWLRAALRPGMLAERLPPLLAICLFLYFAATLLPAGMFNHHDDMHKYLVYPQRMLATGSVGGSPFDTIGYFSLGAQAFLQAFVVRYFDTLYINGFDQVFCLLLAGLLLHAIGREAGAHWLTRLLAVAALGIVNPQIVNVSPVYSGSVLVLVMLYLSLLIWRRLSSPDARPPYGAAVLFGMTAGAFPALKATYAPYIALYVCTFGGLVLLLHHRRLRTLAAIGAATVGAALLFIPWNIATSGRMVRFLWSGTRMAGHRMAAGGATPDPAMPAAAAPMWYELVARMFSTVPLTYGNTPLAYGVPVLMLCAFLAWAVLMAVRGRHAPPAGRLAVTIVTGVAAAGAYLAIPFIFTPAQGIRYFAPILLAALPAAAMLLEGAVTARNRPATGLPARAGRGVTWLALGLVVFIFSGTFTFHAIQAARHHHLNAFPTSAFNPSYHKVVFDKQLFRTLRATQSTVPEGATLLAYSGTPFLLDFRRNRILPIPEPHFAMQKEGLPNGQGPEALRQYLVDRGIRYVLWDHGSPGLRSEQSLREMMTWRAYETMGKLMLAFHQDLARLASRSRVLHNNGLTVVFELSDRPLPPASREEGTAP